MLQLRYSFCVTSFDFFGFFVSGETGCCVSVFSTPFYWSLSARGLCASCFLVSFFSSHRRSGINVSDSFLWFIFVSFMALSYVLQIDLVIFVALVVFIWFVGLILF